MESFLYSEATSAYLKAFNEDPNSELLKLKLARCQRLLNNPRETVMWYRKVIANDSIVTPEDKFDFAMALLETGSVQEAKKWFGAYSRDVPSDKRPERFIAQIDDYESLFRDSSKYQLNLATFNSPYSDFSPTFLGNSVVFVSARKISRGNLSRDENEYSDLYISTKNSMGIYGDVMPFHQAINTQYHEGPIQFYDRGNKLVVTRNNVEEGRLIKSSTGVARLKLHFYHRDEKGNWVSGKSFPFNSREHSVGHPAISEDGKTLYFVSDMPGGYGGTDLYVTHLVGSKWTKPQNLGNSVNTKGNDMFPYLQNGNTLFFASNGHGGMGGLDIFSCDLRNQQVRNLGAPINSSKDDFGFIINMEEHEGFFSSNRGSASGKDDDIYHFKISRPTDLEIKATILDVQSGEPVEHAKVLCEEYGTGSVMSFSSGTSGEARLKMKLQHQYEIRVSKEGYLENVQFITPQDGSERVTVTLNKK